MRDIPSPPRLELSNGISNVLEDAEDIINNNFIREKDLDEKEIEDIKREYNFEDMKNTLDEGNIAEILEFFDDRDDNEKFHINCEMLGIDGDTADFIDFLCSPKGEKMMHENSLSIHMETGSIFTITLIHKKLFMTFC